MCASESEVAAMKLSRVKMPIGLAFLVVGCSANLQERVHDAGFIPLADLDFVQFVERDSLTSRSANGVILIGSTIPGAELNPDGNLVSGSSPLRPDYPFRVRYAKGPDAVLNKSQTKIKADAVKIGKWAEVGAGVSVKKDLQLNNLYQGYLVLPTSDADFGRLAFLIGTVPFPDEVETKQFLWITDVLAADVRNYRQLDANLGAAFEKLPTKLAIDGGATDSLAGPGLAIGVKGWMVSAKRLGHIIAGPAPTTDEQTRKYPLVAGADTLFTILVARPSEDVMNVNLPDAPGAQTWVKREDNEWTRDRLSGPVVVRRMGPPDTDDAKFPVQITNLIALVIPSHEGPAEVIIVNVTQRRKKFEVGGFGYKVVLTDGATALGALADDAKRESQKNRGTVR
jgi:hypothetical protein